MTFHYSIGCSLTNLSDIRKFVRTSLSELHISVVDLEEVVLAMDEMCANLMIHAHHCNQEHIVEIRICIQDQNKVIFEIIDDGTIFDINVFHQPELDHLVQEKRKGGLGVRLVKSIMDKVEYDKADNHYICRLSKQFNRNK